MPTMAINSQLQEQRYQPSYASSSQSTYSQRSRSNSAASLRHHHHNPSSNITSTTADNISSTSAAPSAYRLVPSPSPTLSISPCSSSDDAEGEDSAEESLEAEADGSIEAEEESELVVALHSFVPETPNPTCLSFHAGQVIRVLNKDPTGWWDGELLNRTAEDGVDGMGRLLHRGWFPSNYVSNELSVLGTGVVPTPQSDSRSGGHSQQPSTASKMHASTSSSSAHSMSTSSSSAHSASTPNTSTQSHDPIPPVLRPLLHGLQMLQSAVQQCKSTHYQPSAAVIISCIREILSEANCLQKESVVLTAYPALLGPRKVLLRELAELVTHAQSAAGFANGRGAAGGWQEAKEEEQLESMLRMAGQVFTATRRFINQLDDCGIAVSSTPSSVSFMRSGESAHVASASSSSMGSTASTSSMDSSTSASGSESEHVSLRRMSRTSARERRAQRESQIEREQEQHTVTQTYTLQQTGVAIGSPSQDDITVHGARPPSSRSQRSAYTRVRSLSDLRRAASASETASQVYAQATRNITPQHTRYPLLRSVDSVSTAEASPPRRSEDRQSLSKDGEGSGGNKRKSYRSALSVESGQTAHRRSMSSAASTLSSFATPPTPPFPSGPCSSDEVLHHLRITQDHLLSTVAAFIGHIHNHSRLAHSTSKGHIIALGIEMVEKVKAMLALVDSVLKQPDVVRAVTSTKLSSLSNAKYNLFVLTNELVNFVRTITMPDTRSMSDDEEEEEKSKTLNAATGVLRAARECTQTTNIVLTRANGEVPFVISMPDTASPRQSSEESASDYSRQSAERARSEHGRKKSLGSLREKLKKFESSDDHVPVMEEDADADADADAYDVEGVEVEEVGGSVHAQDSPEQDQEHNEEEPGEEDSGVDTTFKAEATLQRTTSLGVPQSAHPSDGGPSSAVTEETDFNDDSMISFDSEEAEEEEEEESATTPATDQLVHPVVVDPPAANAAHSDEDAITHPSPSESSSGHCTALEEKILYGSLPSVPVLRAPIRAPPPTPDDVPPPSSVSGHSLMSLPSSASIVDQYGTRESEPQDIVCNSDGLIVGATLKLLVERMTPEDAVVDTQFSSVFFLTFRFFAPPAELLDELITRFSSWPAGMSTHEFSNWSKTKGFAIRIRVSNFLKLWLEMYWRPETDNVVLARMMEFVRNQLASSYPEPAKRIQELIRTRMRTLTESQQHPNGKQMDRLREIGNPVSPISPSVIPRPQITKSLFNTLRSGDYVSVLVSDFEAVELARQLTLLENKLFRLVLPEELLEAGQSGSPTAATVKAISSLSTAITGWVTESILSEQDAKKRTALLKFYIKLADRCSKMNNFSTPRSILAALDSATISRLQQTWAAVPQKQRLQFDELRKLADHSRNYAEYRSRLRNTAAPAVPFLGIYLTDITFCRELPAFRKPTGSERELINFNKYHKLARIVQDMQRFQTPFILREIPEVQQYLASILKSPKNASDLQDLYRRSLIVEPRQPADVAPSGEVRQLFGWATRSSRDSTQPTPTAS